MDINQIKIDEIRKNANRLINDLGITYTLDKLINDFKKVYFNMHGEDNRLKIIGNEHYSEGGKQKQRSIQIYRLSKKSRQSLNVSSLGDTLIEVMELCFYIEQLKLIKKIDEIELEIADVVHFVAANQGELSKFFKRNKR